MAETEESRNKFADDALKFITFFGFDGVRKISENRRLGKNCEESIKREILKVYKRN